MRRASIIIILMATFGLGFTLLSLFWENPSTNPLTQLELPDTTEAITRSKRLLALEKPKEAMQFLAQYKKEMESQTEEGKELLKFFIIATDKANERAQLSLLYEFDPESFHQLEEPALTLLDTFLTQQNDEEFRLLRKSWFGRETFKDKWLVLDADKLLIEGNRDKAIALLQSKSFQGQADTDRLIRLALIILHENPTQAWEYLSDALRKDPDNVEIRTYRGRLLETVGKNTRALVEYQTAVRKDPDNPELKHQLADFYLKNHRYKQALDVWKESLSSPTTVEIWEQALFWNKATASLPIKWSHHAPPSGQLYPLIHYYLQLEPGEYWNDSLFALTPNNKQFLQTSQSTFWMQLVQALKEKNESKARSLLQFNIFSSFSWNPELERALDQILTYRKNGTLTLEKSGVYKTESDHPFFSQLFELSTITDQNELDGKIPTELKTLLLSDEAFSAAFLSAGWTEAALALSQARIIPDDFPEWYPHALTEAIRANRTVFEALEFATMQKPTEKLSLLVGELLIAGGSKEAGLKELETLAKSGSSLSHQASWLSALVYIDLQQLDQAEKMIKNNSRLSRSVSGKEALARIALLRGNSELATTIYTSIEQGSAEAQSFLAQKAFASQDWKRARHLTENLLRQYPNNPMIRDNLSKIIELEKKHTNRDHT